MIEPAGTCAYCGTPLLRTDHKGGMLCHTNPRRAVDCMRRRPSSAPLTLIAEAPPEDPDDEPLELFR